MPKRRKVDKIASQPPLEDYYDTFEGRGQDDQDQHDLANDLLPSESKSRSTATLPKASHATTNLDPLMEGLRRDGLPLTRANYLRRAGLTEPLTAELEDMLPPEISFPGAPQL